MIILCADRAIYVNKFEVVDEDILQTVSTTSNTEDMNLNSTCLCESKSASSICNDTELLYAIAGTNASAFVTKKLILLDDTIFLVLVSKDFISIYSYTDEQFYQVAGESHEETLFNHIIVMKNLVMLRNNI